MSSVYESFNIMQVDEETKQVVSSYISNCQHTYLNSNKLLRIIPELVTHLCMKYYYRTNSIYEWKVSDNPQLTNIKNAVPGQSFNHHFKLHKLDWFLKFYPNGTKQSKQGNVFLLLYLRSTPEISKMSATCKVWLQELDKGREHYKDFNEKNKYTGWRSGLVKTSEIEELDKLTFQVTIQIFEIYDKDGKNVTNKYIGLGIDSKQTITYLRKELQYEKAKVQRLTIEVDELYHKMSGGHSNHSYTDLYDDDEDDEKSISIPQNSLSLSYKGPSIQIGSIQGIDYPQHSQNLPLQLKQRESVQIKDFCKIKFESWLSEIVKLEQYLANFKDAECNDVRMIEFFDEEDLENVIQIKNKIHRRLIMKKSTEFKMAQDDFVNNKLNKNIEIKQLLEQYGILSIKDLKQDIKTKEDLVNILQCDDIENENYKMIWNLLN